MAPFENWLSPSSWFETSRIYSIWSKSSSNWSQQYKFPSIVISTFQNHWPLSTQVFDVLEHILFFWIPLNTEGIINFHKVTITSYYFIFLHPAALWFLQTVSGTYYVVKSHNLCFADSCDWHCHPCYIKNGGMLILETK